jgi:hypothetical protein
LTVSDNGGLFGDTTSDTDVERRTLAAGDVVSVQCFAVLGDGGEASAAIQLQLERVNS